MGSVALTLALMITATLAAPSDLAPSAPPNFPDTEHVCNGCHLSTMKFLNCYLALFPNERGQALVGNMLNADGHWENHTVAIISWRGQAWCRDEYFGVFALRVGYDALPNLDLITSTVQALMQKHAQRLMRYGNLPKRPETPDEGDRLQRLEEVTTATRIIPSAATIYWVRSGRQEVPMAFFRPAVGSIAVYEPLHGTCLAQCSIRDDAKVVSLVAQKLGYHPDNVRRDAALEHGALVAAADSSYAFARQ